MIPLLSLMVGAYIFTRMIELFGRDNPNDDPVTKILIRVFSVITAIITVYCVYSIMSSGMESSFYDIPNLK